MGKHSQSLNRWRSHVNDNGSQPQPQQKLAPPLVITPLANGGVSVSGPIGDKFLCFRLLTAAAQAIIDFKQPTIIVPGATALPPPPQGRN